MSLRHAKLCRGIVVHRRYRPRQHELRYTVYSLLVDLDELEASPSALKLFSFNRANLFSLREADHGTGEASGLKQQIVKMASVAAPEAEIARVLMLCFPRVLGYAFNPLTVYYCLNDSGDVACIVYEVNNTFGERQHYPLRVDPAQRDQISQACPKGLHVSPFNTAEGDYEFHVTPPGEKLAVGVNLRVNGQPLLKAYHSAITEPLNDRALLRAFARMPFLTFKVMAGIHFEALRLWLKGLRLIPRPGKKPFALFSTQNKKSTPLK